MVQHFSFIPTEQNRSSAGGSRLFRHIDQRAVGISQGEGPERTFGKELEPRRAFRIEVDGLRAELQVLPLDLRQVLLERVEASDPEADVIHRRLLDAGAVESGNLPRQDSHGDAAVGEEITALAALDVAALELVHIAIEVGEALGLAHAEREVADRRVLLPLALGIDLGTVLVSLLREVVVVSGRVVRAIARERAITGPLHDLDVRVFAGDLLAHLLDILHLDAEVIEASLAAAAARNQGHAGIAIADRDRRHFTRGVARHGHAEYGAIEHPERRVMVGGDGQMIELAEHPSSPRRPVAAQLYPLLSRKTPRAQ